MTAAEKKVFEENFHAAAHLRRYLNTIQATDEEAAKANAVFMDMCLDAASDEELPEGRRESATIFLALIRYAFIAGVNSGLPPKLPVGGN